MQLRLSPLPGNGVSLIAPFPSLAAVLEELLLQVFWPFHIYGFFMLHIIHTKCLTLFHKKRQRLSMRPHGFLSGELPGCCRLRLFIFFWVRRHNPNLSRHNMPVAAIAALFFLNWGGGSGIFPIFDTSVFHLLRGVNPSGPVTNYLHVGGRPALNH